MLSYFLPNGWTKLADFFGNPWVPLGLNKLNKIRNSFLSKLEFFNIPRETKGHWSAGHSGP